MQYLRFGAALVFVLCLMGVTAYVFKRLGLGGTVSTTANRKRLAVSEVMPLDSRRRAVLLKRDDKEHLVILGPSGETVVETDIEAPPPSEGTG